MLKLGDYHNFGAYVSLGENNRVYKPRCCLLEKFLLSNNYLRQFIFNSINLTSISTIDLNYKKESCDNWSCDFVQATIKERKIDYKEQAKIIALLQWLGVDDLHSENMKFVTTEDNKKVLFPIDIETCFYSHKLLSQHHLLPQSNTFKTSFGLEMFFKQEIDLGTFKEFINTYVKTLIKLNKNSSRIIKKIKESPLIKEAKYRLIVRSSAYYANLSSHENISKEESYQLTRGDIPYFFTDFGLCHAFAYNRDRTFKRVFELGEGKLNLMKKTLSENCLVEEATIKRSVAQLYKYAIITKSLKTGFVFKDGKYRVEIEAFFLKSFLCEFSL